MFSKKTIEAYRSITAPASLRNRVMSMDKTVTVPRNTPVFRFKAAAAAACLLAAVVISAAVIGSQGGSRIYADDSEIGKSPVTIVSSDNLSKYAVSPSQSPEPLSLEFFLSCKGETEISVSVGYITSQTGENYGTVLSFESDTKFFWVTDTEESHKNAYMYLTEGSRTTTYELSQNEQTGTWSIIKTK